MNTKWPPSPDVVLSDIEQFISLINRGLDAGNDFGLRQFEIWKREIDPWVLSHLVRFFTKNWVKQNNLESSGFEIRDIAMSGLWFQNERYEVRVFRVDHHATDQQTGSPFRRIRASSISRARRAYYYQPQMFVDPGNPLLSDLQVPQRLKLVLLWDTNEDRKLLPLELACPSEFSTPQNMVRTHWWVQIPEEEGSLKIVGGELQPDLLPLGDVTLHLEADEEGIVESSE